MDDSHHVNESDMEACWQVAFGEDSLLHRIQSTPFFAPLFDVLQFECFQDERFDAYACREEDHYLIAVSSGCEAFLEQAFYDVLSSLQREHPNPWCALGWPEATFSSLEAAAQRLAHIGLDIITVHEFFHVVQGHIDFLQRRDGGLVLSENALAMASDPQRIHAAIGDKSRRALEMAAHAGCRFMLYFYHRELIEHSARYAGLDRQGILQVFAFVSQVIFAELACAEQAFQDYCDTVADDSACQGILHPHPAIRSLLQFSRFTEDFPETDADRQLANAAQDQATEWVSYLWAQGHPYFVAYQPWVEMSDALMAETNALIDHWQSLAEEVEQGCLLQQVDQVIDEKQ